MAYWDTVWSFETPKFRVLAEVTDCADDPRDSFQFDEDIKAVTSGRVAWFDARVRVIHRESGLELGADYLGGCAYEHPLDLFRDHARLTRQLAQLRGKRDAKSRRVRKSIRECLANNLMLDPPVCYGDYGPIMVRRAIGEARKTLASLKAA